MALTPGTHLGPYEIVSALGAGGMGEVYKARDTTLDRDVAIKILPDAFVADPERVARFQREAKTLASLNHPNIGGIYGLEERGGVTALVIELVEGEDLAQRIARGAIPLDEVLPIAKQIAAALEAAHEQGIIHRDLKPANIKVRPDGTVKVLDFGLARAMDPAGSAPNVSQSPTITTPAMTGVGVILGTAAYMAPEQARGKPIDRRADIWAFGVVVYEMLTGQRAFKGEEISDVLAAVLRQDMDWTALPAQTPARLRHLLTRCLDRDPKRRLRDIGEARVQVEDLIGGSADDTVGTQPAVPRRGIIAAVSVALLVGAGVAAVATWVATRPGPPPAPDPVRFTMTLPEGQLLSASAGGRDVAMAPDGRHLVYRTGNTPTSSQLFVRAIDQLEAVPLRGLAEPFWPFISPDNRWVGFFGQGELSKVSMTGGQPITVCQIQGLPVAASWGPDDTIVFATTAPTTGLMSVPAGGGEPKVLTKPDPAQNERGHWFPSMLPGGQAVLFTIVPTGPIENAQVAVLDLKTGRKKTLIRGGSQAEYVETGHLVYAAAGTLRAVRFDPGRREVLGEPVPVVERVLTRRPTGAADFSVSRQGTLVYLAGDAASRQRTLVWVDRKGREEAIRAEPRAYAYPRLSPDGTRVALDIRDDQNDIWIWDVARQTLQRLTTDPGNNRLPVWTPDGKRVAFTAERDGVESVYWQAFDGSGTMERLSSGTEMQAPMAFSPDGTQLIFSTPMDPALDLGVMSLGTTRTAAMLLQSAAAERNGEVSPDGRWLAYESSESGRPEIYVRPFPNVETARHQVSTGGGTRPLWSRTGRELFYYVLPDTIMAVSVRLADLALGAPQPVVKGPYPPTFSGRHYDVSADGQRFLLLKDAPPANGQKPAAPEIHVVVNWTEELKRLVPTK